MPGKQLRDCVEFGNPALVEYEDPVRIQHGVHAVRNRQSGAARESPTSTRSPPDEIRWGTPNDTTNRQRPKTRAPVNDECARTNDGANDRRTNEQSEHASTSKWRSNPPGSQA